MREYKLKKAATKEELEEVLKKYFGSFEFDGEYYVVKNFGAIEELRMKVEKRKLFVESRTKIVDNESSIKTLKTYNNFLEEFTGYSAKERMKMLMREVDV
ncbi:MAG: DUF5611 family protein [Archaeoglobaceae archaeon]|nr:DUF5611 family protein [Archaeoglobaceae archaeon]MCX8151882.1 DUF5611 family protein [Archaeoglobaceae archaeon]MDW8013271.1 DUF5611 family protein [Archaeoglobaceae archaeon]